MPLPLPPPPLSLALVDLRLPVVAGDDLFRTQLTFAHRTGFRAVQLNAAAAGMRPRDLDRSARRDVASLLRRSELGVSGVDLWIPPEHFLDQSQVDRAVAAAIAAIELAADLDRLVLGSTSAAGSGSGRVLSLVLPANLSDDVRSAIHARAVDCTARVADFGPGTTDNLADGVIGPGFDPAARLLADPASNLLGSAGVMGLPRNLVSARLTDANTIGRVTPGSSGGRLDLLAYALTLATASYRGHVVLDVRGVPDPLAAVEPARDAWESLGAP